MTLIHALDPQIANTAADLTVDKEHQATSCLTLAGCLLEHVVSTPSLTHCEKLYYLTVVSLSSIENHQGRSGAISISAANWSARLNCSQAQVFSLQKSLEQKQYFILTKEKNNKKQNKRNIILPTLPAEVFEQLSKSKSRNNLTAAANSDAANAAINIYEEDYAEHRVNYLNKTKLFTRINYHFLKAIMAAESLSDFAKVLFLDLYLKTYKANCCKSSINRMLKVTVEYKALMLKHGCDKSRLSKTITNLKNNSLINCQRLYVKQPGHFAINDRRDHSLWQVTLNLDYPQIAGFARRASKHSNSKLEGENSDATVAIDVDQVVYFSQHSNNKEHIITKIDNLEETGARALTATTSSAQVSEHSDSDLAQVVAEKASNKNEEAQEQPVNTLMTSTQVSKIATANANSNIKIAEIAAITAKEAATLQEKSGRGFNLNFMNSLLLKFKLTRADKIFTNRFAFLNYFAKVLKYEKREEQQVNEQFYQLKAVKNSEHPEAMAQTAVIASARQIENYLASVENNRDNKPESQLRRKIAVELPNELAYEVLTKLKLCRQSAPNIARLELRAPLQVMTSSNNAALCALREKLLPIVRLSYGHHIDHLNLVVESHAGSSTTAATAQTQEQYLAGISANTWWGKIRRALVLDPQDGGANVDRCLFSRITAVEDLVANKIVLQAPNGFVHDRVKTRYFDRIRDICHSLGIAIDPYHGITLVQG